ncbi:MAG: LexA family protein [Thermoguttaceae bacterium]
MGRGGSRKGAGRPKGTGKYGEATRAIRLPVSLIDRILSFIERKGMTYPVYSTRVHAGHSAPADDIPADRFDLAAHLIPNPAGTFFVKAAGDAMTGAGIFAGDLLIVDKSIEPGNGDIVVAVIDKEFVVRRIIIKNKKIELKAENTKVSTIKINDESELNVWGVVKNVIHSV